MKSPIRMIFTIVTCFASYLLSGQTMAGFHIGVNHSKLLNSEKIITYSRLQKQHFLLGGHYSQHVNPYMRWNIKGQYVRKDFSTYNYIDVKQQYLDLIGTMSYCPVPILSMDAGISSSVLLNKPHVGFNDKRIDIGYVIGLSAQYKRMVLSMQYNKSLFNQQSNPNDVKTYNSNLQLTIGYHLHHKTANKKSLDDMIQDTTHKRTEIGISTTSFQNFQFFYKRQIKNNLFSRFGFGYGFLRYEIEEANPNIINYNGEISAGVEKRNLLHGNMQYFYGIQPSIQIGKNENGFYLPISLDFPIGLIYTKVDHFNFGVETCPSISHTIRSSSNSIDNSSIDVTFGTSALRLFMSYWW